MITEEEVMASLDRFGEKIVALREENEQLKTQNAELEQANKLLAADNINGTKDADEYYENWQAAEKKYEGAMQVVHHVVEDTIEKKYEPLVEKLEGENKALGERCLQLQSDKGRLTDLVAELRADIEKLKASADAKEKALEAVNNRLKSFSKAPSSDLDIDQMITKIHTSDVKTSEVDKKLKEIKNERFTVQYEWGRATAETAEKFVNFVKRLWQDKARVGDYYILNKIADVREGLDDNTMNTFLRFLLDTNIIYKRDNSEIISSKELDDVVARITKVC